MILVSVVNESILIDIFHHLFKMASNNLYRTLVLIICSGHIFDIFSMSGDLHNYACGFPYNFNSEIPREIQYQKDYERTVKKVVKCKMC